MSVYNIHHRSYHLDRHALCVYDDVMRTEGMMGGKREAERHRLEKWLTIPDRQVYLIGIGDL
jgi:hypothetical protein